jgi:hypothetical protein
VPNIAHFPQKSMIYARFRISTGSFRPQVHQQGKSAG